MASVLLVTNIFPPQIGGPATFIDRLGHSLAGRGHDVSVVCSSETRDISDAQRPFTVQRVSVASRERYEVLVRLRLALEMARHRLVFVNGLERYVAQVNRALRRRYVLKIVGDTVWETARNRGLTALSIDEFQVDARSQRQFAADIDSGSFRRDVARARTFGFLADVEQLWARGLARGASLENAVVIGEDRVINPEGLRFSDEFVRHKLLDAVGDLALAGLPILGCYRSYRGSHRLNVMALQGLIARQDAWVTVEAQVRRESAHADLPAGIAVAYGLDAS